MSQISSKTSLSGRFRTLILLGSILLIVTVSYIFNLNRFCYGDLEVKSDEFYKKQAVLSEVRYYDSSEKTFDMFMFEHPDCCSVSVDIDSLQFISVMLGGVRMIISIDYAINKGDDEVRTSALYWSDCCGNLIERKSMRQ